ncbi:glycoside hydrolase family 3 C-terminal domain-containing protein [Streptomyces sp. ISL-66]|uniref:glycoside hydrolase family 3 protein n=1 Tax=Streptomyces sp. ISL-66 TaxID=2819186 RepID=UPI001BEB791A|nr:glycoside hydrolase family 3 N-terminal domain-containing protein [Streptomyces sp. ISL-66]MBT2469822.1 glycoside hydrolase family 3 C-terminal domain-containing protein [Streptomyces sp. ISL-66]
MEPYEDQRRPVDERVADLLRRMTLEEKAGMLFQTMIAINADGTLVEPEAGAPDSDPMRASTTAMVTGKLMNHFNLFGAAAPRRMAEWNNRLQDLAAANRLGIPVTISTDPRNSFVDNPAASVHTEGFSLWPEPLGLAAVGDGELARLQGDIIRREYLAVGIRLALHPMADLATEPRWPRVMGTFGSDAQTAARMVAAHVRGLQGEALGRTSVAAMTKHFPGAGPQKDGEDAHFPYGREQVYPGDNFDYHLIPFEAAFEAGTSQIMPYYALPVGTEYEEIGFGFNKDVITGLLREKYGFDGIVCTDWGLVTDTEIFGAPFPARAWGAEHLDRLTRVERIIEAGADQLGGEAAPELIVELVRTGRVTADRIDESVARLLREKFVLGLFDDPYVDPDKAAQICGNAEFTAVGLNAQSRSITVLKDRPDDATAPLLPLEPGVRLYAQGIDPPVAARYATVVTTLEEADVAVLRIATPHDNTRTSGFESFFRAGRLDFTEEERGPILAVTTAVPTVVDIFLDRAAVIPEIADAAAALVANYGASDTALLDVLFGRTKPEGSLPFELPRSMESVIAGNEDVPNDSVDPLFAYGHGLRLS